VQVEQKAYATSWQVGGTARVAETCTIPTAGVLASGQGTVEMWVRPSRMNAILFDAGGMVLSTNASGVASVTYQTSGSPVMITGGPALTDGNWHMVAITWSSSGVGLFVDGNPVASNGTAPVLAFAAAASLMD
jgi:hypothetical protein